MITRMREMSRYSCRVVVLRNNECTSCSLVDKSARWPPYTQGSSATQQSWSLVILWIYQIPSSLFYQRIFSSSSAMLLWTKVCSQGKACQSARYLRRTMIWIGGDRNGKKIPSVFCTEERISLGSEGLLLKMDWENLPLHSWPEQVSWCIDHSRVFS